MQTVANIDTMSSTNTGTATANPNVNDAVSSNQVQPTTETNPSRPPPGEGMSRMLSFGRIFATNDSIVPLLASTDSVAAGLIRSVDLPSLSVESEVVKDSASDRGVGETEKSEESLMAALEETKVSKADSLVANLNKNPDCESPHIVQSGSSTMQSRDNAFNDKVSTIRTERLKTTPSAKPAVDTIRTELLKTSPSTKTTAGSGLFTSREWGRNLGPYQDVDPRQVFQTVQETVGDTSSKTSKQQDRKLVGGQQKTKRDWDAIAMGELEASISQPEQPRTTVGGATPADAALLAAAAAGFGKQDRVGESNDKPVVKEVNSKTKPPKKRMNLDSDLTPTDLKPPIELTDQLPLDDPSGRIFTEPNDSDVLLGRGGRTNNHPGNKKYLEAKDSMQERYLAADKNGKTPISQELVDIVKGWGGRFLKLDPVSNRWYEIDNTTARKKCSQTLREMNTPEERAAKRARYAK